MAYFDRVNAPSPVSVGTGGGDMGGGDMRARPNNLALLQAVLRATSASRGMPGILQGAIRARGGGGAGGGGITPADTPGSHYNSMQPLESVRYMLGPYAEDLLNPGGSETLYNALYDLGQRQMAGSRRAALLGLLARGADVPGSYGIGAMMADLGGASQLSGNLANARLQSAQRNQEFLRALAQGGINQTYGAWSLGEQGAQQRRTAEALQPSGGIGLGPVQVSW